MIDPTPYDPTNFQPVCIDDVQVPSSVLQLASLSPSFCPTPNKSQPPDGNILHSELMEFKRILAWKTHFRYKDFKSSSSLDDFVNIEFQQFQKDPWYERSSKIPPPLPHYLELAFQKVYTSIMQPSNWFHYQSNLDIEMKKAISITRSLPSSGIGVYSQDKSARICFASLEKTNQKVELVLADETKYKKLDRDMASSYQDCIKLW